MKAASQIKTRQVSVMLLKNKKILIVGGTSGFGKQVALQSLALGAKVSIIGRSKNKLKYFVNEQKSKSYALQGTVLDASEQDQLTAFFSKNNFYDHIISTLGGAMGGGFLDSQLADIRKAIEDKFFVNLQLAQAAVPFINAGGSITFTSGTGGHPSNASGAIVGNQAINTLVKGLALEMKSERKRANAVAPTWSPTGLWRNLTNEQLVQREKEVAAQTPLGRTAHINEVASAYVYLMSNDFITGQVLNVDGGVSAS
ncbi:Short-chain alcohol dehydrogenase [Liquorilactobacillus oeni DSM 19972]|uniref:Short-chain alcohol dehydrogenase n=2 Tax=Liquorilactobacillus oeni TaxID=303241 RepID=A0A0R1MMZ3_9LACO|nr:Short-chain alcohol dehydrogenase [Liquorilactobacillus oeni DSM 19972]